MEYRPARDGERPSVQALLTAQGWGENRVDVGEVWVAADDGDVIGTTRFIDTAPGSVYVADVLVREDRRGRGVGARLMATAMASRGGPFFLVCHPERMAFYERLGYEDVPRESWPPDIVAVSRAEEDFESDHDHLHHFMRRP